MWIEYPEYKTNQTITFKKMFNALRIKNAQLVISAIGVYIPRLNGERVGKNILAPGWTSYNHRVQYQTYDVTELIREKNTLEIGVGSGWACGGIGWTNTYYRERPAVIAYLTMVYENGSTKTVITDETWEVWSSSVLTSSIYHGETIDMTAKPKFITKAVKTTVETLLIPQCGEDVIEQERISPKKIIHTPSGELVIDFGQNMTGYVEMRVKGERGTRIVMRHAEVLDKDGNFFTKNYRTARNENVYILSGNVDVFKPSYTFQGFRYIRLIGYPYDEVCVDDFCAIAVYSNMKRTGSFTCGNEKINQLYHNVIWGQKSNYLDIPTDCPQRDERLGWTGDTQVFCRTAAINYDVQKFLTKWMEDLAIEQRENGAVSGIVPDCLTHDPEKFSVLISAAWGDAACIVPWELYVAYGDKTILEKFLPTMKKWVDYIHNTGPEEYLWLGGRHYGDWLGMDYDPDSKFGATSADLIASAFFAYSTSLVIKAGEVVGENVEKYKELYNNVVKKFREYFMQDGMPKDSFPLTDTYTRTPPRDVARRGVTQTALILILKFNLCTEEERPALAKKLVELIHQFNGHMSTGFVGTAYILHALSENGYTHIAYNLLFNETNPSWLYSVCHGATTMWEHWNSIKEDGTFWDNAMNSFNHYAYGSVYDWIFNVSVGITPSEKCAGYKEVYLSPHPDKRLGFAKATFNSRHGEIKAHWYYKSDSICYEYEIPEKMTAHLTLPNGFCKTLTYGKYHFEELI